jgi:hypothetical protein
MEGPVPERSLNAPLQAAATEKSRSPSTYWWAMLLARIYEVFPLRCLRCGEPMRLIAFVTDSGSITRILAYLGEPTQAPRIAPAARGPPGEEDFDPREGDMSGLSEPLPEYEFDQRVSW